MPTKILVVDDEPSIGELIKAVLATEGIQVEVLTSSEEARARLAAEKFDGVFLDVRMPPPDGIELARLIRAGGINRTTPVVMITGETDLTVQQKSFSAGANFFLFKPLDRHRLLRVVRTTHAPVQREKRRFERIAVARSVSVALKSQVVDGLTIDISLSGLQMQGSDSFPEGSEVAVELNAGRGGPVRALGRVVRVLDANRMGIEFLKVDPRDVSRFQQFLLPLILKQLGEEEKPQEKKGPVK